ncbi:MAG: carboxynorspermidine decarboxylase [Prevotella sp.]|nr:carboxynorspermidine decarboxylase [Prevotella sp.]MDY3966080.1 carboxynorspermidine decarboxylase [Prevotella sp.]
MQMIFNRIKMPAYILEEEKLRRNLSLIKGVADEAGIEIILAFKAFALWKTFPIFREYINSTTASSLSEARLAYEEFGAPAHTFSPAYTDLEIEDIARMSSHLTFNSLSQYSRHHTKALETNSNLKLGVRVNPEYSEVGTDIYNPCAPGTRFGVLASQLPERLPEDISGFHCHCHCESGADVFQRTLVHIEEKFSKWFDQLEWINFGGGHLMTRKDYDIRLLIDILKDFKKRYPNLKVILEPGSAFAWQTGPLVSHVVDVVENKGIKTAILDVSFTCHMPDCLEMPYWPTVRGAETIEGEYGEGENIYRLGGNSCLSGDWMQSWKFDHALQIGETVIFEDMIHYTTVKTCTFNGITHPDICLLKKNGELQVLRHFDYQDYKNRMD